MLDATSEINLMFKNVAMSSIYNKRQSMKAADEALKEYIKGKCAGTENIGVIIIVRVGTNVELSICSEVFNYLCEQLGDEVREATVQTFRQNRFKNKIEIILMEE